MSKLIELAIQIEPFVDRGDLDDCERVVAQALTALKQSPFHIALNLHITNRPEAAAEFIDQFVDQASREIELKAICAEMDGFDTSGDRWFFNLHGYDWCEMDSLEWLGDFAEESFEDMTLEGLEPLQRVYAQFAGNEDPLIADARDAATLLVLLRFQKFIRQASKLVRKVSCPIYATAHGFEDISTTRELQRAAEPGEE